MVLLLEGRLYLLTLWERQGGRCPECGQRIEQPAGWHNYHVVRKVGGGDELANRVLLHPDRHRRVHRR